MSRKGSTDDYGFKSGMFCKNGPSWILGSYLRKREWGLLILSRQRIVDSIITSWNVQEKRQGFYPCATAFKSFLESPEQDSVDVWDHNIFFLFRSFIEVALSARNPTDAWFTNCAYYLPTWFGLVIVGLTFFSCFLGTSFDNPAGRKGKHIV